MILPLGYIGPGAGFAFLGSFLILLTAIGLVALSLLTWPFRALAALLFRRGKRRGPALARRVIVVGLDGFDPGQYRRIAATGKLPNLRALEADGMFGEILSSCPPISPVAWSSFSTGTNPGKHNIFDFLGRSLRTYAPELSSVRIRPGARGKPVVEGLRRSKTFWEVLGEHGVFSTIIRVPVTFPPQRFHGLQLSGMCIPDLRGTQGSFTLYTSGDSPEEATGGLRIRVDRANGTIRTTLPGPPVRRDGRETPLHAPMRIANITPQGATLNVSGERVPLEVGRYTPWVRVTFRESPLRKVSGICRFCLIRTEPDFRLYVTPVNVDPERPAFPISHPAFYSIYLAKLLGPFATLGLAEDTWGLNEGAMNEQQFLDQVYAIQREREAMFFEALRRTRAGLCACVFDAPDRIQHMFPPREEAPDPRLVEMYERMDEFVGRVMKRARKDDALMVLSDHGFTVFRRGVNLNTWLQRNGYLALKPGARGTGYLQDIDWSKTRAHTFGLSGIYLNKSGREAGGIVDEAGAAKLRAEIAGKLRGLRDDAGGAVAIREVYDATQIYDGPYRENGPDLVIGYERGYRASWDAAIGKVEPQVFSDNPKHWSGDHCVDYRLVPGVFFCNRKFQPDGEFRLVDVGPTILKLFGVPTPKYMDGKAAL